MERRVGLSLWTAGILVCGNLAAAQPATPANALAEPLSAVHITLGQAVYPLYGPWKFSIGDSPQDPATHRPLWAEPGFDDSSWETVDLMPKAGAFDPIAGWSGYVPGWTTRGHPGYSGYAWYRIRVTLDGDTSGKLALSGPNDLDDAFQAFIDGALLGSFGDFSKSRPVVYGMQPTLFKLPAVLAGDSSNRADGSGRASSRIKVFAFRLWMEPSTLLLQPDVGGFHTAPLLGQEGAVSALYQVRWIELIRGNTIDVLYVAMYLVLTVLAFSLSIFDRSDKVYYWIGSVYLISAIHNILNCLCDFSSTFGYTVCSALENDLCTPLIGGLWVMVWFVWFQLKGPRWLPKVVAAQILLHMVSSFGAGEVIFGLMPHPVAVKFNLLSLAARLAFAVLLVVVVVLGVRQRGREAWVALPAVVMLGISRFSRELSVVHIRLTWFPFGFLINIGTLAVLSLMATLFFLLLRRVLASLRRQREQALDIKQAAEVQQVILPEAQTAYSGVRVESEYRPARLVGGDFFQVIPNEKDGGLLLVAGDVTGKGLQAGMLVALLVGAIRMAAELKPEPLFVLEALNRRLLGRSSAQATCLAMSVAADGWVMLANAGHIPPYINGSPVAMEGALPLGMIERASFPVMRFKLNLHDELVVISDGVLEATNERGELFGFDRVAQMLAARLNIRDLALAAQRFGQFDDISLIALTRTAAV